VTFAPVSALVITAALVVAQPAPKLEELYQHVQQRVLDDVARIPKFTCVQTITRRVYATSAPNRRPPSCEEIVRDHNAGKHNPPLVSWDRLRLDVAIADKHEVFSWVGAAKFEDHDLHELVGGGQTEIGDFGPFLLSVFYNHQSMRSQRMSTLHGQRLVEYSYETPLESSHYDVRVGSEVFTTAYDGSAFLDPTTRDLVRLTARSAPLPAQSGFCRLQVMWSILACASVPPRL